MKNKIMMAGFAVMAGIAMTMTGCNSMCGAKDASSCSDGSCSMSAAKCPAGCACAKCAAMK